jgi:hypothetical protein
MGIRYYSANTLYMYVKYVYLWHCWWLRSYSVGDRWMNDYGALVKWYWQGETEVLGEKPVPQHLVHHKSHKVRGLQVGEWDMVWPDISQGISGVVAAEHKTIEFCCEHLKGIGSVLPLKALVRHGSSHIVTC